MSYPPSTAISVRLSVTQMTWNDMVMWLMNTAVREKPHITQTLLTKHNREGGMERKGG